jgi:AAA domain-containing protein
MNHRVPPDDFDTFEAACRAADAKRNGKAATHDNHVSGRAWNDGLITARELQSKKFKPVRIILSGLIPEGVTLLAGKPKVGKSWLALDVCLAVADETRFVLGEMRPVHGAVLYLALEDNERRLKKRIDKIVQGGQANWPELLSIHTEWKRMDQGGLEDIEAWIKEAIEKGTEPRLIWIDTLAKIRPIAGRSEQAYAADYRAIDGVQKLAGQCGIGVVFNTHLRKAPSEDDPFDEVSGTLGLTAAADTTIVMKRHSGMVKVYVRGRDIAEAEFAAEFNRETCRWRIVGGAEEAFRSQERQAIIGALKDAGADEEGEPIALPLGDIMTATERRDRGPLKSLLHKMRKANEVVSPRVGYYALPSNPLNPVDRVDRAIFEGGDNNQVVETTAVSGGSSGHRPGQQPVNGAASVDRALTEPEQTNPLDGNEDCSPGQRVNAVNGIEHSGSADSGAATADDGLDVPDSIVRTGHRCDHCGSIFGAMNRWDWLGRPDGIRLHSRCEAPWFDSHKPARPRLVCDSPSDLR